MSADQLSAGYDAYQETPDAATHFWRALHAYVTRVVRAARVQDADDVAQVITVAVWRALPQYRSEAPFTHWLRRIVRNHILNARRDHERYAAHVDGRDADPDTAVCPDSYPRRDFSALPDDVRHIAVMLTAGHTLDEVARARGCSTRTVRRMVERHTSRGERKPLPEVSADRG